MDYETMKKAGLVGNAVEEENEKGFAGQDLASDEGSVKMATHADVEDALSKYDAALVPTAGYPGEPATYDWQAEQRFHNRRLALEHAAGLANRNTKAGNKAAKAEDVVANAASFLKFLEG